MGEVMCGGTISYSSQEPWLFVGTVKQNILFGEEFDLQRYCEVIKVCGLSQDLDNFELGDQTMVGERGLKLSRGQKVTMI